MEEDVLIPFIVFSSFAITFIAWLFFRHKTRVESQHTIRLALEKGNELSPEFIKQIGEPEPPKDRDLRRGMIWIAIGISLALLAVGIPEDDATGPMLGSASFPTLIGVAYLIMWRYGTRKQ